MRTFDLLSSAAICEQLGDRIKRLRLLRNISQQELADMTQSSLSSIRRLEAQGSGSLELLVRCAQALQVVDQFEPLLDLPVQTIAQAEQKAQAQQRQRARAPRRAESQRP